MTFDGFKGSVAFRLGLLGVLYTAVLVACRWLAFQLRFDFAVPSLDATRLQSNWPWELAIKLLWMLAFGQFSASLSSFSSPDLRRLGYAMAGSAATLMGLNWFPEGLRLFASDAAGREALAPGQGIILIDLLLSVCGLAALRVALRSWWERHADADSRGRARRVGIIGAGNAGTRLARELLARRGLGLRPVAFFDDARAKWGSQVHGLPVVGPPERLRHQGWRLQLEEAIIAMPSAPAKRISEVVRILQEVRLRFETVPSLGQLSTGGVSLSQLRAVEIDDLLGREPVALATASIEEVLRDRVVLVTGAGGSIGSELCRQIATYHPRRLLLVEQSEAQLFEIEQELLEKGLAATILPLIADVLDVRRMASLFQQHRPAAVLHAAAHKHVPMMESQPGEAIKNNLLGAARLAELAREHRVERFVLVSTDKAINPTSVMGATKRLTEMYVQALQASDSPHSKFMAVRFGNVLGSSGSVVPIFRKQIACGGPVKVTHPEVSRYFMTIPEAAGLVLQSAALGAGGEIFVLDMGKPIKIVDLARQLIELSGLKPDEDIAIEFTGLRAGEKLCEELAHHREELAPTAHPKILRLIADPIPLERAAELVRVVTADLDAAEPAQLKARLKQAVPEYQPYLG